MQLCPMLPSWRDTWLFEVTYLPSLLPLTSGLPTVYTHILWYAVAGLKQHLATKQLYLRDFKFSRRRVWCSELSETSVDNHFTRQYNPEDNSEQIYLTLVFVKRKPLWSPSKWNTLQAPVNSQPSSHVLLCLVSSSSSAVLVRTLAASHRMFRNLF
jgi:hypothetical protein